MPPRQLARQVDRVGAAAGEHDLGARDGADLDQAVGEPEGRLVREAAERVVGLQLPHLLVRGLGDAGPPVSDVRMPQAGRGVEQSLARRALQPGALTAREHQALRPRGRHVGLGVPERPTGRQSFADMSSTVEQLNCGAQVVITG